MLRIQFGHARISNSSRILRIVPDSDVFLSYFSCGLKWDALEVGLWVYPYIETWKCSINNVILYNTKVVISAISGLAERPKLSWNSLREIFDVHAEVNCESFLSGNIREIFWTYHTSQLAATSS